MCCLPYGKKNTLFIAYGSESERKRAAFVIAAFVSKTFWCFSTLNDSRTAIVASTTIPRQPRLVLTASRYCALRALDISMTLPDDSKSFAESTALENEPVLPEPCVAVAMTPPMCCASTSPRLTSARPAASR